MPSQVLNFAPPPAPSVRNETATSASRNTDAQSSPSFGSVLAQQIDAKKPAAPATSAPAKQPAIHGQPATHGLPENDTTLTASPASDAQATVLSMLGKAEIKDAKAASTKVTDPGTDQASQPPAIAINPLAAPVIPLASPAALPVTASNPAIAAADGVNNAMTGKQVGIDTASRIRNGASPQKIVSKPDLPDGKSAHAEGKPVTTEPAVARLMEISGGTKSVTHTSKEPELTAPAPSGLVLTQPAATGLQNNNVAPTPANAIAAPLGSSAWPDEFSQKISWISTQQNQVAELHLNPPDLGPMSVVVSVTDNQATALFSSPHSAVREAIENALPQLRNTLADSGIMLGNATVSDQAPRDSGSGGFTNQRNRPEINIAPTTLEPATMLPVRRHIGMVDTFA